MFYSLMQPKALEQHLAHPGFLHSASADGEFPTGQHGRQTRNETNMVCVSLELTVSFLPRLPEDN